MNPTRPKNVRSDRSNRIIYMQGYLDSMIDAGQVVIIDKTWYIHKFRMSLQMFYKDIAVLKEYYPNLLVVKSTGQF